MSIVTVYTKSQIMDTYWLEFLRWVKEHNSKAAKEGWYEQDATEINFWHWYIDHKLEDEKS